MRRISLLVSGAVGAVCGVYAIVYLVRWEWNRAIIAGIFFLAVEIIVVSAVVIDRLRRVESRLDQVLDRPAPSPAPNHGAADVDPTLDAIRAAAPPPGDRFGWIRDQTSSMGVFLPVLLGAGVLASAVAWLIEHLARATVSPTLERRLAVRLDTLALPPGGLRGEPVSGVARRPNWARRSAGVVLAAATLLGIGAGIDVLGDMTQTRPDVIDPDAQTVLDVEVRGAVANSDRERVVDHLWSVCTSPDVFRTRELPVPVVTHDAGGTTRIVVDADIGDHSIDRLRGCLNDAKIEKVQARVLSVTVG